MATRNISHVLDQNISGTYAKIDLALHNVTDEAEHQLATTGAIREVSLNNYIVRLHSRLPVLTVIT